MKKHLYMIVLLALMVFAGIFFWVTNGDRVKEEPLWKVDVPIKAIWSGDYPVAELGRLPDGQQDARVGYVSDGSDFEGIWAAFKPGQAAPEIDFENDIVVFVRNTESYNSIRIFKVRAETGEAEVMSMETRPAVPIENTLSMSMAVIPRKGLNAIRSGKASVIIE